MVNLRRKQVHVTLYLSTDAGRRKKEGEKSKKPEKNLIHIKTNKGKTVKTHARKIIQKK
jgi:hypothetical protein